MSGLNITRLLQPVNAGRKMLGEIVGVIVLATNNPTTKTMKTRRRSQHMQPQEGTPLTKTTNQ